jgi:acyl-CoA synthetase (NDP forming)
VTRARDLSPLFAPRAVALVGASADAMAWGGWLAGTLDVPGGPPLHLVNRRGGELAGRPLHPSLSALPQTADLAVLAIPADAVASVIDEGLAAGTRAFVVIAAGFAENGADGRTAERALVERVRAAGGALVGPNCLGVYEAALKLNATGFDARPGPVAFAAQSGNLAIELGGLLDQHGLGYSRLVALGNAADVSVADVLWSTAEHDDTRLAACYVEDTRDGRALVAAVRRVAERKPVLVLAAGRSAAGAAAAASHTGALAAPWRVLQAALEEAGARLVHSLGELADAAAALLGAPAVHGRGVGIVSDGGGNGAIAADLLTDAGLDVPALDTATVAALQHEIPSGRVSNPVDLAGAGERDVLAFARIGETLLAAPGIDMLLLTGFFGGYATYDEATGVREVEAARRLAAARELSGRPLLVHTMHAHQPAIRALAAAGVPVYDRLDTAVRAMGHLPARTIAPLRDPMPAPDLLLPRVPAYHHARALLEACGIPLCEGELATTATEAGAIARRLGGPLVLKLVAPALLHKTEARAVVLSVAPEDAEAATADLLRRLAAYAPAGVFVERMAPAGGVDLIVGARRDPSFGPVILVGAGGIHAEALGDVALALAPAHPSQVECLLRGLHVAPLLVGDRGTPPVDLSAVARVAVALGDLLCGRPDLAEAEANPLRADEHGALALDARVVAGSVA